METSACTRCTGHVVTVLGRLGLEARIICTGCRSTVTVPITHLTAHELDSAIPMREVKALQRQHATTSTPEVSAPELSASGTAPVPVSLGTLRTRLAARLASRWPTPATDPEVPATTG